MAGSMSVDQVLSQIRAIRQEAIQRPQMEAQQDLKAEKSGFGEMLSQSVNSVNAVQKSASQLAQAFERGDSDVSLAEVMVASQKANVSFTAMVEVRNKMIDAYQEVMRMSV